MATAFAATATAVACPALFSVKFSSAGATCPTLAPTPVPGVTLGPGPSPDECAQVDRCSVCQTSGCDWCADVGSADSSRGLCVARAMMACPPLVPMRISFGQCDALQQDSSDSPADNTPEAAMVESVDNSDNDTDAPIESNAAESGLPIGVLIGAIVGVVALLAAAVLVALCVAKRRSSSGRDDEYIGGTPIDQSDNQYTSFSPQMSTTVDLHELMIDSDKPTIADANYASARSGIGTEPGDYSQLDLQPPSDAGTNQYQPAPAMSMQSDYTDLELSKPGENNGYDPPSSAL